MPKLTVEVCYAVAERQALVRLQLPAGATAGKAIEESGLPGPASGPWKLAIHGRLVTPEALLHDGDRIDILRPLVADPKETRRQRARGARRARV